MALINSCRSSLQRLTLAVLLLTFSVGSSAAIYGSDDRNEVNETWAARWSTGVLVMVPKSSMELGPIFSKIKVQPASGQESNVNLCSHEKFSSQILTGPSCSGFLVAPDLLVTAGECITKNHCENYVWLADFAFTRGLRSLPLNQWDNQNIFTCSGVVSAEGGENNFAIIRLARPAYHRHIFIIGDEVSNLTPLYTMGFPMGLPMKFSGPGRVLDTSEKNFFSTNLDIQSGNSGGPVFDSMGHVHGIMISNADADFIKTDIAENNCKLVNICRDDGSDCLETRPPQSVPGERAQKIAPISRLLGLQRSYGVR